MLFQGYNEARLSSHNENWLNSIGPLPESDYFNSVISLPARTDAAGVGNLIETPNPVSFSGAELSLLQSCIFHYLLKTGENYNWIKQQVITENRQMFPW